MRCRGLPRGTGGARGLRILAGNHFKYVKKTSEPYKRPHCAEVTACLGNRTNTPSRKLARTRTLNRDNRGENMVTYELPAKRS
jgi:hypothetical protein